MPKCGFDNGFECIALKEKDCEGCNFFKTPEQIAEGRRATIGRLDMDEVLIENCHKLLRRLSGE